MGPPSRGGGRRVSPWPHVVWVLAVAGVVAIVLVGAADVDQPEGRCEGLGWGCAMSGDDLVVFVASFIVPPALVVLAVGHLVIWLVQRRAGR